MTLAGESRLQNADNNLRKTVPVIKNKTIEVKKADPEPVKKIEKMEEK